MNGLAMFTEVLGGLCIFLLGMKYMSEGMQAIAGNRLRRMIQIVTNNRLKACATGAMVTSVIQSSSVTSVMVIGMVSAGLMTLTQAIGVVLGADIGTTITAYLASLGATTSARRVAYGHILTKVIGVTAMISIFPIYLRFLNQVLSVDLDIAKKIAFAHTVFNVLLVAGFLPLVTPFVNLLTLHDQTTEYIHMVNLAVKQGDPDILPKAVSQGETITYTMKEARQSHIRRVEEKLTPPLACLIMVDMLQSYRRIKDHTLNIAETLAGEK